ncbi:histidine--tRNA ligase [candidate division WOR-3 bacterium]|nr:histidine--tRNA ligase [candidate division WOR-3 bacterium]
MGLKSEFKNIKGTRDILPEEAIRWKKVEDVIRKKMESYNFQEVRFPAFEATDLFRKSTGESTDIVKKEMFTFEDMGGRSLTLKPEGTPSVVRMYLQHGLFNRGALQKFYYIERMFRQERPQKGRYREFRQFGAEVIGSVSAETDAELVKSALDVFKELNIKGIELNINSIGCPRCRKDFVKELKSFLKGKLNGLCEDCNRRYAENPMRILDCKIDRTKLKDAPVPSDFLCDECREHFEDFKKRLDFLKIKFNIDSRLVRGLDYYTKTVFEFVNTSLGSQNELGGGGRYDELIKFMGGEDTPASGYAVGIDRMMLLLPGKDEKISVDVYLVTFDVESDLAGFEILNELRERGFSCDKDPMRRSVKAQFREADRQNAKWVIIIGENEIKRGVVQLKNMNKGKQKEIPMEIDKIVKELKC